MFSVHAINVAVNVFYSYTLHFTLLNRMATTTTPATKVAVIREKKTSARFYQPEWR